ncbi:TetR/AcrR family transcriptional regulator [Marivirga arenosa]|uniref:TetR family transcriptional regulator C-terminal domain-containing protein n=1 Tax=Marivirga arenosa TaxID=3059076 RepID=A0AA49GDH1_9BACT|nr:MULTISPECIES: TetR family transcriptional regulator C-terminal domain-containing protein [unclassified Marivirga]WKK82064.2 TetR family transcriptional regulator C-terminal domain-containing protein [Marivirga sp. BKB1-2]WMN07424.1 TetR family transcriptional regulator C-terminal domain-containing protein [Marivirga sp. ABR2-2]
MAKKETAKAVDLKIKEAYIDYVLENGKQPASIYKFSKDLKLKEVDFYNHFNSFQALQKHIWADFFKETVDTLHAEEAFVEYTSREKLLALYFTLIEILKVNRSYAMMDLQNMKKGDLKPSFLEVFKKHFLKFVDEILLQGKETEEIMDRPIIGDRYSEGLWIQTLFILQFWANDESKDFEKTDAAIEKAVNVAYDLMGKSPLDSMFDFAKFLFQNR